MDGRELVELRDLNRAVAEHDFRANLFEEEFMADYDREIIKVATGGTAVGRANGLSVTLFGDYEFGLPHQISCTVGVGHGGILDLEREAQLGGPIHTKGMMIIKSYLVRLFAQDKPLVLTGSLCFEQNYAGVEGDSASGAELAALLSALSGAPIDLSLAFTGAVSQSGAIMAVGGVNRKVEGFFEVCRRRGSHRQAGRALPGGQRRAPDAEGRGGGRRARGPVPPLPRGHHRAGHDPSDRAARGHAQKGRPLHAGLALQHGRRAPGRANETCRHGRKAP